MPATQKDDVVVIFKTVPIINEKGEVLLFDMYVNGVWHGSRRTQEQVDAYFKHVERVAKQDG